MVSRVAPDGSNRWSTDLGGLIQGMCAGPDGSIYATFHTPAVPHLGTPSRAGVVSLRPDGSERWRDVQEGTAFGEPLLDSEGVIHWFLLSEPGGDEAGLPTRMNLVGHDGVRLRQIPLDFESSIVPALLEGGQSAWVGSDARLRRVDSDGVTLAEAAGVETSLLAPTVASDGTVYVMSRVGEIVSWKGGPVPASGPWTQEGGGASRWHRAMTPDLPLPPIDLVIEGGQGASGPRVHWNHPTPHLVYHELARSSGPDSTAATILVSLDKSLEFVDEDVAAGRSYWYWVRSMNVAGTGDWVLAGEIQIGLAGVGEREWRANVAPSMVTGIAITTDGQVVVVADDVYTGNDQMFRVAVLDDTGGQVATWTSDISLGRPSALSDGRVAVPFSNRSGQAGRVTLYGPFTDETPDPTPIDLVAGAQAMAVGEDDSLMISLARPATSQFSSRQAVGISWINGAGEVDVQWTSSDGSPPTVDRGLLAGPVWTTENLAWGHSGTRLRRHIGRADSIHPINVGGVPSGLAPAPDGGVYWVAAGGVGYTRLDGMPGWSVTDLDAWSGPVLTTEGLIVVGTSSAMLVALTPEGEIAWETDVGGVVDADPVVTADGHVWCMTRGGRLIRANAQSGEMQMAIEYGIRPTCALRLSSEGVLYVGTDIGEVWAFQVGSGPANGVWAQEGGDAGVSRRSPYTVPTLVDVPQLESVHELNLVGNHLVWESVPGAVAFEIWRAISGDTDGAWRVATINGARSYIDSDIRKGETLMYQLRAMDVNGQAMAGDWIEVVAETSGWEWSVALPERHQIMHSPVILSDDSVVVIVGILGTNARDLMCWDAAGELRWSERFAQFGTPLAVGLDDVIHVVENVGTAATLLRVSAAGEVLGRTPLPRGQGGPPGINGMVAVDPVGNTYVLGSNRLTFVLADGSVAWSENAQGVMADSPPVLRADGVLLYNHMSFIARRAMDGRVLAPILVPPRPSQLPWQITLGKDDMVHRGSRIMGLDTWDTMGNLVRTNMSAGGIFGTVISTADGSVFGCGSGTLVAWDADGREKWRYAFEPGGIPQSSGFSLPLNLIERVSPAVDADGNVMVCFHTRFFRVGPDGELQGITDFDHWLTGNPILSESGRVYITGLSRLHALSAPAGVNPEDPWPMEGRDRRASRSAITEVPALTEVTSARIEAEIGRVRLELGSMPVPTRHEVLRSNSPDPNTAELVAELGLTGMLWESGDLPPNSTWYFWIRQLRGEDTGPLSAPIKVEAGPEWIRWRAPISPSFAPVTINPQGGLIHVTSSLNNFILTFNPDGGSEWHVDLGNPVPHQAVAALDGSIRVVTTHEIIAIDPSGEVMWREPRIRPPGQSMDVVPPALSRNGNLHAGRGNGALITLSAEGEVLWAYEAGASLFAGPLVLEDGAIAIATQAGAVIVLEPDGELRWRVETEVAGSGIFGSFRPGYIAVPAWQYWREFDVTTGEIIAREMPGTGVRTPLVRPDGQFWFDFQDEAQGPVQTWAFNGEERTLTLGSPNIESRAVSVDGGVLGVRTRDLVGLSPEGDVRWQIFGYTNGYPPVIVQELAALRMGQPVLDRDGRVYFTFNRELICVQTTMALASTRWPMAQGSVRQSATLEPPHSDVMLRFPSSPVFMDGELHFDIEINADARDGVELWRSGDMRHWRRAGYIAPGESAVLGPWMEEDTAGYFRAVVP
jgi:hypothetical protein